MNLMEAIRARHSVRSYTDRRIEGETLAALQQTIDACNREGGLSIQLCTDEPNAFAGMMARYGRFENVRNYVALVGKKDADFDEKCGYYGEKIVLRAQQLGLNTCWVAMSYSRSKSAAQIGPGEKLLMVISIGYGTTQGAARKTKPMEELAGATGDMPPWFKSAMEAVQLAPTAMNQQKFRFELEGNRVKATKSMGPYTKVDLGIAKYHFEVGAGDAQWNWA